MQHLTLCVLGCLKLLPQRKNKIDFPLGSTPTIGKPVLPRKRVRFRSRSSDPTGASNRGRASKRRRLTIRVKLFQSF